MRSSRCRAAGEGLSIPLLLVLRVGNVRAESPCWCNGPEYPEEPHRGAMAERCAQAPAYSPTWSSGSWATASLGNETAPGRLVWRPGNQGSDFQPFDATRFCDRLKRGKVLFVGDSTTQEMYESLRKLLEGTKCRGQVAVVRNDLLNLDLKRPHGNLTCSNLDWPNIVWKANFLCAPWADRLPRIAVLVMNTGIHVRPCDTYINHLAHAIKYVRDHLPAESRAFFRNTVPGYNTCRKEMADHPQPHPTVESAESYVWENPYYASRKVVGMNLVAESMFQQAGIGIIDAYSPSVMRKERRGYRTLNDGRTRTDCLHFGDHLGPVDHWNALLFNALLQ